MKLTTPLYAPFVYTGMNQGKLVVDQSFFESMDREVTEAEIQEALAVNYFGDSMFKRKRYGACISRARLFASMLRAAGIPVDVESRWHSCPCVNVRADDILLQRHR